MIEKTLQEFTEFMDGLYYEGFTQQFAKDYPAEFTDQLNQYLDQISWKPLKGPLESSNKIPELLRR